MDKKVSEIIKNPRFVHVLKLCLNEPELLSGFERLYGVKRPAEPKSEIDRMVDKATGYYEEQMKVFFDAFANFVYEHIWLTFPDRDNPAYWTDQIPKDLN